MNEQDSGRHPVNIGHLVMGIAFLGLVGIWALIQGDVVNGDDIRWLLPIPWVFAGVAGLLATTLSAKNRHGTHKPAGSAPALRLPTVRTDQARIFQALRSAAASQSSRAITVVSGWSVKMPSTPASRNVIASS